VQLSRQSEKTKPRPLLHMSHEKDQRHLGAGADGMPGYGVARDAEQLSSGTGGRNNCF